MRARAVVGVLLALGLFSGPLAVDASPSEREPWSPEQAMWILRRLGDREPFVGSFEAWAHRDTLGHFFHRGDYERLRGNPVFGYWDDGRFRWTGTHVAWDGIQAVASTARPITARAWTAAFGYVARKHGMIIDPKAAIRVRGACIGAVLDPTVDEPNRGVVLELRIESPSGAFLYRFGTGKPTIEDAIGASLDWALSFALTLNQSASSPPHAQR